MRGTDTGNAGECELRAESRGGHGRFAKRRTTGPCRNGRDCLNAATVLDCAARARDDARRSRNCTHFVGWVEPTGPAFGRPDDKLRETHHRSRQQLIDIAALHPSYKPVTLDCNLGSFGAAVKNEDVNPQIQIVRLISSSKRISDSNQTPRQVRFALHVQSGSLPRAG